jgi:hypothetical protein
VNKVCYKQSRLTNNVPFGVCSAYHGKEHIALCPRRFLQHRRIFVDIANSYFGSTHDLLLFSEVRLPDTGNFDFVMVKHKPLSAEVEDFIAIEFQTGQTTSTGGLVEGFLDFMNGKLVDGTTYDFGLNTYDVWKRAFTQILNKGIIMENWRKKVYWVIQDPIYRYFEKRYNLHDIGYKKDQHTVFALYDIKREATSLEMIPARMTSASVDQLFNSFRNNPNIPPLDKFVEVLHQKIRVQAQLAVSLDMPVEDITVDVSPPTESDPPMENNESPVDF